MSLSLLSRRCCSERPGAVKGAPLLGAAQRTLDGEDRSEMIAEEGKAGRNIGETWAAKMVPSPTASNKSVWARPAADSRSSAAYRVTPLLYPGLRFP